MSTKYNVSTDFRPDNIPDELKTFDRITGIDLDNCNDADTGEIADLAMDIMDDVDSYTEISPSNERPYHRSGQKT